MNEAVCVVWFFLTLLAGLGLLVVGREVAGMLCFVMATIALVGTAIISDMKRLARKAERRAEARNAEVDRREWGFNDRAGK